ncbi:zinc finger protein 106 [Xiphophorus hellerii]|uniref:zinc finger protein 106 n=1 Tax=Xiphophorus hellerii TaxID=8084 RepID=UPI0013B385E9|nr:zinc finger protein 106-like [Xiphophorus hellerii]XP_032440464.1 zinc finger protein 106-like [Xiphophorus hellerii]XP_032440465.1 zinc finger protein 106-like [Xiphophorus hellerii]XP_032440466.1 zinc finger protein 106-like [Xiphophorus hellerii]
MADVQNKKKEVQKALKKPKKKKPAQPLQNAKTNYCIVCRNTYLKNEAHDHMQSMHHHNELEKVLGKDAFHNCQACKINSLGLNEYGNHILTSQHQTRFKNLKSKNVKPVSLDKILSSATIESIMARNKALRNQKKKEEKKTRKKQKQKTGNRCAKTQQSGVQSKSLDSKGTIQPKQMQMRTPNQWQQPRFPGSNYGVIQNKENKMFLMEKPPLYRPFPDQNWRPPYLPSTPVHQPFHHQYGWHEDHQWHNGYFANNQYYQGKMNRFQSSPYSYPSPPAGPSKQMMPTVSQSNFNQQKLTGQCSIPSRPLPHDGANLLDHNKSEKGNSTQPKHAKTDSFRPESSNSSAPGHSENKSGSQAPMGDVGVGFTLKQIRRALGVREPCRADREARRQNGNDHTEDRCAEKQDAADQQAETPAKTGLASTHATSANAGAFPSTITPPKQKQTTSNQRQKPNQTLSPQLNDNEAKSQEASNASTSVMPAELNFTKSPKVRVAHKSSTAKAAKETIRKPILDKLRHLSRAKSRLNWDERYSDMKRKSLKGVPRFGIKFGTQPTDVERPLQEGDLPLSEGFHWESFPDSLLVPSSTVPCSQGNQLETQSESQTRDSSEQPDVPQASYSSKTAKMVSVKVEPKLEDENEEVSRKRTMSMVEEDGLSDRPNCKKKKTKSRKDNLDQSQMDQLLAVSLREDELSHSLQDLDQSMIQARNALQAAYAEVQRLLLLKQQITAEVNNLRTKRIEILQGMQEGYSEATIVSPGPASTMPSTSFPSSLNLQQPAATRASSMTLPQTAPLTWPAGSLKQEVAHVVAAGQTSQLFVPSALQPTIPEVPTSAHGPPPESFARQQEQEPRDRLTCVKTKVSEKQIQSSDVVEGAEENQSTEQDIGEDPGKEQKKVLLMDDEDDEGNESDDSVEVVNASKLDVIHIEESECEDSTETVSPEQPEDPQKSVSVELNCVSTQTFQQCETERKSVPAVKQKKDVSQPAESVEEEDPYLGDFLSHSGPVHGLQIHNGQLYTCSGDNTARAYSLLTRECEAVFQGHTNKVNCLLVSSLPNMLARLYTGSSDQTIRCYSIKSKKCLDQITLPDRVLCLHIAWNILYVGLASGCVVSYDLKALKELDMLECHGPRGVSCLGTSQEGARRLLLVGSYDSTISVRDAKSGLLLRTLEGHTKTVLCMKVVNDLVFSGSSDTSVHAHNIHTGELVRIYKGHGHAVTSIVILGKVMVTACLDKLVRVYELQSHDRLQVYGGHSDMVMCMAVHKSVIYTGCYNGSVQAVKLNLLKNYRCWWQSCSLIFGIQEHLFQHLIQDHSNSNMQTVKCRWKECNHFFSTQQSVRQELPEHLQNHIESDGKLQP